MTILDQINIAIQDQTGNNHPPQRVTITKTYQNNPNLCDITTKNGNKLTKIPVQGTPQINTEAILIYEDGDQHKPLALGGIGLESVYTKAEIDQIVEDIISGDIDLTGYMKWSDYTSDLGNQTDTSEFLRALDNTITAITGRGDL